MKLISIMELILLVSVLAMLAFATYNAGYKNGQIDALSGTNIRYELVTKQVWEAIKK